VSVPELGPASKYNSISVNRHSGKRTPPVEEDSRSTGERRRIGQVVHDDRGVATVAWSDAPSHHERQVLEIEGAAPSGRGDSKLRRGFEPKLTIAQDDTFNPYDRKPDTFGSNPAPGAPKGAKRDLKKLSEWLKLMRALEERKKNGEE
jgi:hypothetical protein